MLERVADGFYRQGANRPTTSEAARDGRAKTKAHDPQPSGRTEEFVEKSKEMYQKISGQNDRSLAEIMDSSTKAARDEINKLENVLHPAGPAVPTAQPAKITPERPLGRR